MALVYVNVKTVFSPRSSPARGASGLASAASCCCCCSSFITIEIHSFILSFALLSSVLPADQRRHNWGRERISGLRRLCPKEGGNEEILRGGQPNDDETEVQMHMSSPPISSEPNEDRHRYRLRLVGGTVLAEEQEQEEEESDAVSSSVTKVSVCGWLQSLAAPRRKRFWSVTCQTYGRYEQHDRPLLKLRTDSCSFQPVRTHMNASSSPPPPPSGRSARTLTLARTDWPSQPASQPASSPSTNFLPSSTCSTFLRA